MHARPASGDAPGDDSIMDQVRKVGENIASVPAEVASRTGQLAEQITATRQEAGAKARDLKNQVMGVGADSGAPSNDQPEDITARVDAATRESQERMGGTQASDVSKSAADKASAVASEGGAGGTSDPLRPGEQGSGSAVNIDVNRPL